MVQKFCIMYLFENFIPKKGRLFAYLFKILKLVVSRSFLSF